MEHLHKASPKMPPCFDFKTLDIIDHFLIEDHIRTPLDAYILASHTDSTSLNHPKNRKCHPQNSRGIGSSKASSSVIFCLPGGSAARGVPFF